jgi:hypothetical protein
MEVRFAPIGLMAVPSTTLNVVMLVHTWRRPAISRGRIIKLTIRLLRPKSRVLGRETKEWGAMRITVILKVLERGIQGRMVVKDVI